jgi:hypothetical protein
MAALGWKRFRFFEERAFADAPLPAGAAVAAADARGGVWLGLADGLVVRLGADLAVTASFRAHAGRVHALAPAPGRLLTLGEDGEGGVGGLWVRAWDVGAAGAAGAGAGGVAPPAAGAARAFAPGRAPEGALEAAALHAGAWPAVHLALGLAGGAVAVLRGELAARGGGRLAPAFPPYRLPSAAAAPVTGLHFAGAGDGLHLFAVSTAALAALDARSGARLLEDGAAGAAPRCSALAPGGELLLAGADAVYAYTAEEGRKAAHAVRGPKFAVAAFGRYLAAVVPEDAVAAGAGLGGGGGGGDGGPLLSLRVFDLQAKVVAGAAPLRGPLAWLAAGAGFAAAGGAPGGAAARLRERPLPARLEALLAGRAFRAALDLAARDGAPPAAAAEARRRYGDALLARRDFAAAAEQYAGTVGHLEPSYAVRRFLDAGRVGELAAYLEALHDAASDAHNCAAAPPPLCLLPPPLTNSLCRAAALAGSRRGRAHGAAPLLLREAARRGQARRLCRARGRRRRRGRARRL